MLKAVPILTGYPEIIEYKLLISKAKGERNEVPEDPSMPCTDTRECVVFLLMVDTITGNAVGRYPTGMALRNTEHPAVFVAVVAEDWKLTTTAARA